MESLYLFLDLLVDFGGAASENNNTVEFTTHTLSAAVFLYTGAGTGRMLLWLKNINKLAIFLLKLYYNIGFSYVTYE